MANLVDWIVKECNGASIEGIVITPKKWIDCLFDEEYLPQRVISWDEAQKILDYEFHDGYGAADCHAIYVWTRNKVLFIAEYDGSTTLKSIPRNPTPCFPKMV